MRPDFQRDATARHRAEDFLQCFRCRPHPLLHLDLAGFIHHAVPTVAVSEIQSNGQFLLQNILALLRCLVLTFFIAGLLFICALSTSITWERTASRLETGLLIPSDFINRAGTDVALTLFRWTLTSCTRGLRHDLETVGIDNCWRDCGSCKRHCFYLPGRRIDVRGCCFSRTPRCAQSGLLSFGWEYVFYDLHGLVNTAKAAAGCDRWFLG